MRDRRRKLPRVPLGEFILTRNPEWQNKAFCCSGLNSSITIMLQIEGRKRRRDAYVGPMKAFKFTKPTQLLRRLFLLNPKTATYFEVVTHDEFIIVNTVEKLLPILASRTNIHNIRLCSRKFLPVNHVGFTNQYASTRHESRDVKTYQLQIILALGTHWETCPDQLKAATRWSTDLRGVLPFLCPPDTRWLVQGLTARPLWLTNTDVRALLNDTTIQVNQLLKLYHPNLPDFLELPDQASPIKP